MSSVAKSPWILHYDASSCNGCDIETLACLTPIYDVERLGIVNTGNPKHADIFLVTGAVNEQSKSVISNLYSQMPEPKAVVAIGACAATGGIFRQCYNICGGVDCVIPVDVYVSGCAARPEAIIDGVVKAISVLDQKQRVMKELNASADELFCLRAQKADAADILALRYIAAEEEARIAGRDTPQTESKIGLGELEAELEKDFCIKAVVNGKIIGWGRAIGPAATVSTPFVHPYFRDRGVADCIIAEIKAGTLKEQP